MLKNSRLLCDKALIGGSWIKGDKSFAITNPANGEEIIRTPDLGRKETRRAIEVAHQAMSAWRLHTAKERAAILKRWYQLIMDNQDDLATLLSWEQGKPLAEAKGEIAYGASFIEWFAEEGKRVYGDTIPAHIRGKRILVQKEPIGVVAAITPWNFPNAMITRKIGPALAAGCAVVVKPAPDTPLSALALGILSEETGLPPGLFNVVTAKDPIEVGDELCKNPLVRKLSFTGSTKVGKFLLQECASTVKKVSLELGGNAPFIVFDDADLDLAISGAMISKYRNSGQTCVCANRFLVEDGIYDSFAQRLKAEVLKLKVGPGLEVGNNQGPLINEAAVLKVEGLLQDAVNKGAKIICGGARLNGTFFAPTIVTQVTPDMLIAREEIFGPVAPLFRFKGEEEAIGMANATSAGLAAYFYSRDLGRSFRVAEKLEYGMVGVNEGLISTEVAPFGGVKESGLGREGSKYGIDEFLEIKYICIGGIGE